MVLFFVIGDFNFGAVGNGRDRSVHVDAHPQIIEDVDAMETLFDDDAMTRLGEIHSRCKIKFTSFYGETNKSE